MAYDPSNPDFEKGCTGGQQNLAISTRFSNRVDSFIGKIDHNFNASNLLTGRYYFGDSDQSFPELPSWPVACCLVSTPVNPTRVQLVSLSYVKVVNSNQLNEARLGWHRFAEGFFPETRVSIPIRSV